MSHQSFQSSLDACTEGTFLPEIDICAISNTVFNPTFSLEGIPWEGLSSEKAKLIAVIKRRTIA
jgi:hypothetical protein